MVQPETLPTEQATKHDDIVLEEEQLYSEPPAYYYCIPFIQKKIQSSHRKETDGLCMMCYFPALYCCISKQLYDNGKDNIFTTVFLPYCLDSLRYKQTREKHKIYCIWETLININFILCYSMFFSSYVFIPVIGWISGLLVMHVYFLQVCSHYLSHRDENSYWYVPINWFFKKCEGPINWLSKKCEGPINWFIQKCGDNYAYFLLAILLLLLAYISMMLVLIIVIILLIISFVFFFALDIVIILVAIVVELVLLVLFVIAFIVWNVLFCFYPISCIIYTGCVCM